MSEDFPPLQERDRLPYKAIWRVGAIGVVVTLIAIVASGAFLRARSRPGIRAGASRTGVPESPPEEIGFVEQGLFSSTHRGLDQQRARREAIEHYGWVDREHGVARIPIERAIDLEMAIPLDRPLDAPAAPAASDAPREPSPARSAADGGL